jgi:ribosomal protein L7Ae-like RNA K-turn-binding protein
MNESKIISLLGLAQRAGKAVSGEFAIEKNIRAGKIKCLIIAADASDNTRKNYRDMCKHFSVTCFETLAKEALSSGIGKENRAAIAITDPGIAAALQKLLVKTPK